MLESVFNNVAGLEACKSIKVAPRVEKTEVFKKV